MEKLYSGGRKRWREYLKLATMACFLIPHFSTGFSPFQILTRAKPPHCQRLVLPRLSRISNTGMLFENMPKRWMRYSSALAQGSSGTRYPSFQESLKDEHLWESTILCGRRCVFWPTPSGESRTLWAATMGGPFWVAAKSPGLNCNIQGVEKATR